MEVWTRHVKARSFLLSFSQNICTQVSKPFPLFGLCFLQKITGFIFLVCPREKKQKRGPETKKLAISILSFKNWCTCQRIMSTWCSSNGGELTWIAFWSQCIELMRPKWNLGILATMTQSKLPLKLSNSLKSLRTKQELPPPLPPPSCPMSARFYTVEEWQSL